MFTKVAFFVTVKEVIFPNIFSIYNNSSILMLVIYCSDEKADFSALLLQSLVSNEPSEII